jgi:hypothetical protein
MNITLKVMNKWVTLEECSVYSPLELKYGNLGFAVTSPVSIADLMQFGGFEEMTFDYALPQSFFDEYMQNHSRRPIGVWSYANSTFGQFLDLMPVMTKRLPNLICYGMCDAVWTNSAKECDAAWIDIHPKGEIPRPSSGWMVRDAVAVPIKDLMTLDPEWLPTLPQLAPVLALLSRLQERRAEGLAFA